MAFPLIAKLAVGAVGLFTGANMIGKLFGTDPDFTQAWMMNRMTGRGRLPQDLLRGRARKALLRQPHDVGDVQRWLCAAAMFMNPMAMGAYGINPYMMMADADGRHAVNTP